MLEFDLTMDDYVHLGRSAAENSMHTLGWSWVSRLRVAGPGLIGLLATPWLVAPWPITAEAVVVWVIVSAIVVVALWLLAPSLGRLSYRLFMPSIVAQGTYGRPGHCWVSLTDHGLRWLWTDQRLEVNWSGIRQISVDAHRVYILAASGRWLVIPRRVGDQPVFALIGRLSERSGVALTGVIR